jgi:hypothetical protein
LPGGPQVRLTSAANVAVNPQVVEHGIALHIVRYDFDEANDIVPPLPSLAIDIRLPMSVGRASIVAPGAEPAVSLKANGEEHRLELSDLPLYSIVLLEPVRSDL